MKIIISGGGTGGHIYPAVAIANELKAQVADAEILFVGALGKMEMEKVPKVGYDIVGLPVVGFNRSNLLANLGFPFKLIQSLWRAYQVVRSFRPDITIGVGGFASGPTLAMANLQGVKSLIQEQNSYAGVTNKILSKWATKICVAYPEMKSFFPEEKLVFTGNPVRNDLLLSGVKKGEARKFFGLNTDKTTVLVVGGSLGAMSINTAIEKGLEDLRNKNIQLIWQTGKNFQNRDQVKGESIFVSEFIYEMDKAYAAADFVVSRAGALSISELSLLGKASILVPFPYAAEDHQTKNAESLTKKDAAIMVLDKNVELELIDNIIQLAENPDKIEKLKQHIIEFAKPDAASEIVKEILNVVNK